MERRSKCCFSCLYKKILKDSGFSIKYISSGSTAIHTKNLRSNYIYLNNKSVLYFENE
jgi:hypothetical protein